ncbi:hypothetical protein XENOCAPTIV_009395 [Xenoophorus captivus]|uniref:SRCR domain-containing protein n=1 Tax=Xenoophorus captivus TaxID=1517983 RepID=A0ABV0Q911_9TELE
MLVSPTVDAQIRLVGPSRCSGRVEVNYSGIWGTVCDDGWDLSEATVVCRQVGCGLPKSALMLAYFGEGTGQIWLDDVACAGNEGSLPECPHNGFGNHNCGHGEDAGVICEAGAQVRLAGPTRCSGRVEVLFNNTWGTVCDDSWDLNDAAVVCRQMGCGLPQTAFIGARFGEGTGPIWLTNVGCSGKEDSLTDCSHSGFGMNSCGHAEDAGVICGKLQQGLPVRLIGPGRCSGRVEVYHNQTWGTVCDDGWDLDAAEVVCMELGCDRVYGAPVGAHYGLGAGSILLDNLVCSGTESSLSECAHSGFGLHNCVHNEDAGALCEGKDHSSVQGLVAFQLHVMILRC